MKSNKKTINGLSIITTIIMGICFLFFLGKDSKTISINNISNKKNEFTNTLNTTLHSTLTTTNTIIQQQEKVENLYETNGLAWQATTIMDNEIENLPKIALPNTSLIVQINPNFKEQEQLSFSLPNGQIIHLQRQTLEFDNFGTQTWVGVDHNQKALVGELTQNRNIIVGNIKTQDGEFSLTTLNDGRHLVYQVNTDLIHQWSQMNARI